MDKAVQADQVVKERYNTQCEMITLLCKPENELSAAIPSANPTKTLRGSEVCAPQITLSDLSVRSDHVKVNSVMGCIIFFTSFWAYKMPTVQTHCVDIVYSTALYLLPAVAPFFILTADFAQCVTGEL